MLKEGVRSQVLLRTLTSAWWVIQKCWVFLPLGVGTTSSNAAQRAKPQLEGGLRLVCLLLGWSPVSLDNAHPEGSPCSRAVNNRHAKPGPERWQMLLLGLKALSFPASSRSTGGEASAKIKGSKSRQTRSQERPRSSKDAPEEMTLEKKRRGLVHPKDHYTSTARPPPFCAVRSVFSLVCHRRCKPQLALKLSSNSQVSPSLPTNHQGCFVQIKISPQGHNPAPASQNLQLLEKD